MDSKNGHFLTILSTKQVAEMYAELNTTEEKIDNDVELLLEWARKQPHMPNIDDEKKKVKSFLITCKNSLERTKEMLDNHYTVRTLLPKYFIENEFQNSSIKKLSKFRVVSPLPMITKEGNRVTINHFKNAPINEFNIIESAKVALMNIEIRMSKLDVFKKDVLIVDFKYFSFSHLAESLPYLNELSFCVNKAYPIRVHELHILNAPNFISKVINILRNKFTKISERLYIHKNIDDLKHYIEPEILPINYGGTFPKTSEEIMDEWIDEVSKHFDWLLHHNKLVVDERKRLKKSSITLESLDGSFRKLEID